MKDALCTALGVDPESWRAQWRTALGIFGCVGLFVWNEGRLNTILFFLEGGGVGRGSMVQRGWYLVARHENILLKSTDTLLQLAFVPSHPPIQGWRSGIMAFYIPNWGNLGLQEPCWFVVIQDSMICFNCGGFGAGLLGPVFIQVKVLNLRHGRRQHKSRGCKSFRHTPHICVCASFHRIGWWESLQESPIFDGKNNGFL